MAKLTIEGSLTPSSFLARGERATVQRTPRIDALVLKGYAVVVDAHGSDDAPAEVPAEVTPAPIKAPAKSASREDWAEFLAAHTSVVTEGRTRDQLIGDYEVYLETHDAPAAE